jgi:predicted lipoprotein
MKVIKCILVIVVVAFVIYNSIYFRKLNELQNTGTQKFNAVTYTNNFMEKKLTPALTNAIGLNDLMAKLQTSKDKTFDDYSHALAIGNQRYFLVKGKGIITAVNDDDVTIKMDSTNKTVLIATEFIYGNAIRDASGLIDNNTFTNTTDFNNVSAEINKTIRTTVIPEFKKTAKVGAVVEFAGALELNKEHMNLDKLEIIPIKLIAK